MDHFGLGDSQPVAAAAPGTAWGGPSVSPLLVDAARRDKDSLLATLRSGPGGLSDEEAADRLHEVGPTTSPRSGVALDAPCYGPICDPLSIL